MKTCTTCQQEKSLKEFSEVIPKSGPSFRRNVCKSCIHEAQRKAGIERFGGEEGFKNYRHKVSLKSRIKKLYELELEEAENLLFSQDNKCKICLTGISFGRLLDRNSVACIDHCHRTKKVRGILCHKCNVAIGLLQESQEIIKRACDYLS
jgi:hypothetical protein